MAARVERRALILLHIQNDFFQGGKEEVPGAEDILPNIARLREVVNWNLVIHVVDWHPANHSCFSSNNPVRAHAFLVLLR